MLFLDASPLDGFRISRDGYLIADVRLARSGLYRYAGHEVGRPDLGTVMVYRPEAEVFSADAMRSFAHRPVTNEHPPKGVTAETWRRYAVGTVAGEIKRDGIYVRASAVVQDAAAIAEIRGGKREVSAGYLSHLDWTPGRTGQGEAYDAVMRGIVGNHVALVARGRAGSECRVGGL